MPAHKMKGPLKDTEVMKKFKGKESPKEEMAEAKSLRNGEMSLRQYKKGEAKEGHKADMGKAKMIAKGKMTPKQYAEAEQMEKKKMANGGKAMKKKKC